MQVILSVNDRRPVQKGIRELESRLGRVITYEDPPFTDPSEIADVAPEVRRSGDARQPVLVPKGGKFDVTVDVEPDEPASLKKAIEEVLAASARTGNSGVFRVEQAGDVFHVIPTPVRDRDAAPLLDTHFDTDGEERSALEWIDEIVKLVGRARGVTVSLGTAPVNLLDQHRARLSSKNETARSVLRRLLGELKEKVSWDLLYDPGQREYVLNLHVVPARAD